MTRVHVLYNQATGKYVLWTHLARGVASIATANTISGPWNWQPDSTNPDGLGLKDFNLFQDDDGTAYVVYTDGSQQNIVVSKLTADYLGTTASISDRVQAQTGTQREAPVMFKRGAVYFLITSAMNYYNPRLTYSVTYQTASAPLGTWSVQKGLYASDPSGTDFNGQPSFIFRWPERREGNVLTLNDRNQDPRLPVFRQVPEQYVLGSDYWNQNPALSASRQVWLPLSFPSALTVVADTPAVWDLATWGSRARQRTR